MPLVNVQVDDFLEVLVKSLVTVCDYQSPLVREIVVNIVDHLHCYVRFSCT